MATSFTSVLRVLLLVMLMVRAASAQTFTNGSFETGDLTGWQVSPSTGPTVLGNVPGTAPVPVDGSFQALINSTGGSVPANEPDYYKGVNSTTAAGLQTFLGMSAPLPSTFFQGVERTPVNGQAIVQTFSTPNGATITFYYAYYSREVAGNQFDGTGYVLNGVYHKLADSNTPNQSTALALGFFTAGLPYQSVTITVGPGTNTLGFVAYNTGNTNAPTGLFIDNVTVTPLVPVTITPLDPSGSISTHFLGVSGSNVVGVFSDANGQHGLFYDGNTFTTLDYPGSTGTLANAVSGANVAGWYNDNIGNHQHGFLYDGANFTEIDPPASQGTTIAAISGSVVVGTYSVGGSFSHGFIYDSGTTTNLIYPASNSTVGTGISGSNVVGWYIDQSSKFHGYEYNITSATYITIDPPGSTKTEVTGISGNNIVGWFVDSSQNQRGFFYDGTNYTVLNPPGSMENQPFAISGTNVVGNYGDSGGMQHGYLFDGTTYTVIDPPNSIGTQVSSISGNSMVGYYTTGDGVQHGFQTTIGVGKTFASITLDSLFATYDGTAKSIAPTTNPPSLGVTVTYNGSTTAPTAVGSYPVVATINDATYQGSAMGTFVIGKAAGTVSLSNLTYTYDGTGKAATATTTPSGLNVDILYDGGAALPVNAGSYNVVATINDSTYQGTGNGVLVISQATATVTLGNLNATYNGSPKSATATTAPSGLNVTFTYDGSSTPPSAIGNYTVIGTVNDPNYTGSNTGTLVIAQGPSSQTFSDWLTSYSITGTPTDTPQHDTIPNLMKYLYDIDPTRAMTVSDQAALPVVSEATVSGTQYLTLTYRQYALQTGITINVQKSTDLQNWTTVSPPDLSQQIGMDGNDAIMQVGVIATGTRQFIRLQVTMP